jgi:hypothetical protein
LNNRVEANNPEGGLQASSATVVTKKNTPPDALCVDIILYLLMAMDFQPQTRIRPASVWSRFALLNRCPRHLDGVHCNQYNFGHEFALHS